MRRRIISTLAGAALTLGVVASAAGAASPVYECVPSKVGAAITAGGPSGECKAKKGTTYTTVALPSSAEEQQKLLAVLPYLKYVASGVGGKPTIQVSGANLQIVDGAGKEATANGAGNVVIGYDEAPGTQTGSHNLILGSGQTFSSFGSLIAGLEDTSEGPFSDVFGRRDKVSGEWGASVTGGEFDEATSRSASVVGGYENRATNEYSSIGGGNKNVATGREAAIAGGALNEALSYTSIAGGYENKAEGEGWATVSGGERNTASGNGSTVSGGEHNTATGQDASVSSGYYDNATAEYAWVAGGQGNEATHSLASATGGAGNTASGYLSSARGGKYNTASGEGASVSGGYENHASGNFSSILGGRFVTLIEEFTQSY